MTILRTAFFGKHSGHFICIAIVLIFCIGCQQPDPVAISWNPNLDVLQKNEARNPELNGITRDVGAFYEDLHAKRWESSYDYRADSFRNLVSSEVYVSSVKAFRWELKNYEILDVKVEKDAGGPPDVILICKFFENPMHLETYNTITWQQEHGKWRCDAAGPANLPLSSQMVRPAFRH